MKKPYLWGGISVLALALVVGIVYFTTSKAPEGDHGKGGQPPPPKDTVRTVRELAKQAVSKDEEKRQDALRALRDIRERNWKLVLRGAEDLDAEQAKVLARLLIEPGLSVLDKLAAALRSGEATSVRIPSLCVRLLGKDAIAFVATQVNSPRTPVRLWVVDSLRAFPEESDKVLPVLARLTADPDEQVAVRTLQVLGSFGDKAAPHIVALCQAAGDRREPVRSAALAALSNLSDLGEGTGLKDLTGQNWALVFKTAEGLSGAPAEALARLLIAPGVPALEKVATALRSGQTTSIRIPSLCVRLLGKEAIPYVASQLDSPSAPVRLWVVDSLRDFPNQPDKVLHVFARLTDDPDEQIAVQALQALRSFGRKAQAHAERVRAATTDKREAVRSVAFAVLAAVDPANQGAAEKLLAGVTSQTLPVTERLGMLQALARLPPTEATFKVLMQCAAEKNPQIQRGALDALLRFGSRAAACGPQVLVLLKSRALSYPEKGLEFLSQCRDLVKEVEPIAADYLQSKKLIERRSAVACLTRMADYRETTVQALLKVLTDEDILVRLKAVEALAQRAQDPQVRAALSDLSQRERQPQVRGAATAALTNARNPKR